MSIEATTIMSIKNKWCIVEFHLAENPIKNKTIRGEKVEIYRKEETITSERVLLYIRIVTERSK